MLNYLNLNEYICKLFSIINKNCYFKIVTLYDQKCRFMSIKMTIMAVPPECQDV